MPKCRECGKFHDLDNKYFCPKCQEKCDKRGEFRNLMNQLKTIIDLPYPEYIFMSGFSYAELERFSLIFMKLQQKYHLPLKLKDFVNESAKTEAEKLFKVMEYS